MKRPACTDKVLRGILALGKPLVTDAIHNVVSQDERRDYGVTEDHVADALAALEWARAMMRWKQERKERGGVRGQSG